MVKVHIDINQDFPHSYFICYLSK